MKELLAPLQETWELYKQHRDDAILRYAEKNIGHFPEGQTILLLQNLKEDPDRFRFKKDALILVPRIISWMDAIRGFNPITREMFKPFPRSALEQIVLNMESNPSVLMNVMDLLEDKGFGVVIDVNNDRGTPVLVVDFGGNGILKRLHSQIKELPAMIEGEFVKQAWTDGDHLLELERVTFDASSSVFNLNWANFVSLEDNSESTDAIGELFVDHEGPFSVNLVSSIFKYFGLDLGSDTPIADAISEEEFIQAKELYDSYHRQRQERNLMDAIVTGYENSLRSTTSSVISKCEALLSVVSQTELRKKLVSVLAAEAREVQGEMDDLYPAVRFGDETKPCWRVSLTVPTDDTLQGEPVKMWVHANTLDEAAELAKSMVRMHMKNAMRQIRVLSVTRQELLQE